MVEAVANTSSAAPPRRRYNKFRRRRMDTIGPRMAMSVAMACGLMVFSSVQQQWSEGGNAWSAASQEAALEPSPTMSGYGFGDLHRQLQTASPPPALNLASLIKCDSDDSSNSTFPSFSVEPQGAAYFVQILVMLWMFLGLAIVCDSFFEAALSRICEAMDLKDDVAGATWMAAGGSAPELATSVLGVFVSRNDVGFGTIVGSAVFNVLFVIACCAFVAPNLKLTWWPLARDASFYCFSMAMLVFVISDLKVWHYEAVVLLALYGLYVTVMYFNERLEAWVTERVRLNELQGSPLQVMALSFFSSNAFGFTLYALILANTAVIGYEFHDDGERQKELPCVCGDRVGYDDLSPSAWWWVNFAFNIFFVLEMLGKWYAYGFFGYWKNALNAFDGALVFLILIEFVLTAVAGSDKIGIGSFRALRVLRFVRFTRMLRLIRLARIFHQEKKVEPTDDGYVKRANPEKEEEPEEEEDDDDDEPFDPFEIPEGMIGKFFWFVGFPLSLGMYLTIPDCRREMFKKWWLGTFSMCIVWIAVLSYFMVWMVTEFGTDVGIPDTVMGVTLLAMGTSIPDALSSIAVARRGHGDMAVSSSIGSNIFDILIGLPLPWFLYGAILRPAVGDSIGPNYVPIISDALAVMILSLFVMVALVVVVIHVSGWVLSVKLGGIMMVLYFMFLGLSLMLEYDVILGPC